MSSKEKSTYVFASGLKALQNKGLSQTEHKVLWWLVANLPIGGGVVKRKDIQDGCGISQPVHVTTYMQNLIKYGFIRRMAKINKSYFYMLNPNWFKIVQ